MGSSTFQSPTKSSSSYAGDDDTELMMDELLMAPTITGPTTLRPLLPRYLITYYCAFIYIDAYIFSI